LRVYGYVADPLNYCDPLGLKGCGGNKKEHGKKGAKRGPKTDKNAPHNKKIREEGDKIEKEGGTVLSGGGREQEKLIPTPGVKKVGDALILYTKMPMEI